MSGWTGRSREPTVSVVIPCHRAQETIADTVASVLAQTYARLEVVLVSDDGDDYLACLATQGVRDRRLRQHPLRTVVAGHVAARNRGMAFATGEFIADLDADDLWHPQRLARLLPLAARHGAAQDLLECFDERGVLGLSGPADGALVLLDVAGVMCFDLPFHLLVRRDLAGDTWFAEPLVAPDVIRTAVLAARAPIAWLREPLLRYRVHAASLSQSLGGDARMDADYARVIELLAHGHGFGLGDAARAAALAGFERKRALNRAHMAACARDPALPSFVPWVLAGGGARAARAARPGFTPG